MKQVKREIAQELSQKLEIEVKHTDIETPEHEHGDLAYPCMKAAAQQKSNNNPREIAQKLKQNIQHKIIENIEVAGPGYLNFHLNKEKYTEKVTKTLQQDKMGVEQQEGKILLEFSSPNIAKPMHIGHVRNNCIGDSLQRILRFIGYNVTSENYLGDWGAQFGKSIFAFKKYGSEEKLDQNPMEHIYNLYVKFHEEAENDPEINEKAAEWTKRIEQGDEEAKRLWEKLREITIKYNQKDYQRMNIKFDRITGESKVVEESKEILKEGLEKNIFKEDSDGSIYVEFSKENMPNTIVQKADGTTLYLTRDIANIKKREKEGFDQNMYVVASEQDLHFQQLFSIAEDFEITDIDSEHISYGMLQLESSSMSSREGNIITLSDMLDKARDKAKEKIKDREIDNVEAIGLGAIKYANLSVSRNKDITFDWDRVLDFEGDSGPYLQYSNTRAQSLLKQTDSLEPEITGNISEEEYRLVKQLAKFPEKVENAAKDREPAKIANYLSTLCEEFNKFYHECQVVNEEQEETTKRRLELVKAFEHTTNKGLELLGIETVEEM